MTHSTSKTLVWQVERGMKPEVKKAKLDVKIMLKDTERIQLVGDDQRITLGIRPFVAK